MKLSYLGGCSAHPSLELPTGKAAVQSCRVGRRLPASQPELGTFLLHCQAMISLSPLSYSAVAFSTVTDSRTGQTCYPGKLPPSYSVESKDW